MNLLKNALFADTIHRTQLVCIANINNKLQNRWIAKFDYLHIQWKSADKFLHVL